MEYVTAVVHAVEDIDLARRLLVETLDFTLQKETSGRIELSNGALTVYLLEQTDSSSDTLRLAFKTDDLQASIQSLNKKGFTADREPQWVSDWCQAVMLHGPENIRLDLFREYDEDELGVFPDLPKALDWAEDAEQTTKQLLTSVPVAFRVSARSKITQMAEADTIVEGDTVVSFDVACRAIVKVTPDFQHDALKAAMITNRIDPGSYFDRDDNQ